MAAIFEESKIFWKLPRLHCLDTLRVENFDEILHGLGDRHIYLFAM